MAAGDLVGVQAEALGGDPALEVGGKNRSSRPATTRVGTSGQRSSGHGSANGRSDWPKGRSCAAVATSSGTSWKKAASMSSGSSVRPWLRA
jgi:hypothetical protein